MKKTILLLLVLCTHLSAQGYQSVAHNVIVLPAGMNSNALSGYGFSDLLVTPASIGNSNPANLDYFSSIKVGLSYQYNFKVDEAYIAGIGSDRVKPLLPQSFGLILPLGDFRFSVSGFQKYNSRLLMGEIAKTSREYPDGTGDFFRPDIETTIYTYSAGISYTLKNLFKDFNVTLAGRVSQNYLKDFQKIDLFEIEEDINELNYAFGLSVNYNKGNRKYIKFSGFYETSLNFNKISKYSLVLNGSPGRDVIYNNQFEVICKLPAKTGFDFDVSTFNDFKLLSGMKYLLWNKIDDFVDNQFEFSSSLVYLYTSDLHFSFGFLYSNKVIPEIDKYFKSQGKYKVFYNSIGMVYKYSHFDFDIVIADSHLFSGDFRKETIIKTNISISL